MSRWWAAYLVRIHLRRLIFRDMDRLGRWDIRRWDSSKRRCKNTRTSLSEKETTTLLLKRKIDFAINIFSYCYVHCVKLYIFICTPLRGAECFGTIARVKRKTIERQSIETLSTKELLRFFDINVNNVENLHFGAIELPRQKFALSARDILERNCLEDDEERLRPPATATTSFEILYIRRRAAALTRGPREPRRSRAFPNDHGSLWAARSKP